MKAYMRTLGTNTYPLDIVPMTEPGVCCVEVSGFGHLLVMLSPAHPRADSAILTQSESKYAQLPVTRPEGRIECELLHNADRLCVVIDEINENEQ